MRLKDHFELLASYNQWMNSSVYEAASRLSHRDLAVDRQAFFGSILGTLNHIVVGDTIWLKRFATHPSSTDLLREIVDLPHPTALNQIIFQDLEKLSAHRVWLDDLIIQWIGRLSDGDLASVLDFRSMAGVPASKPFSQVILHFFNHQTHHRGQVSVLLSQAGEDVGTTDLLALIPNGLDG